MKRVNIGEPEFRYDEEDPDGFRVETPAVTVYPDSDKVGIWTGNPDDDVMVHKSSKVGYFSGEAGSGPGR